MFTENIQPDDSDQRSLETTVHVPVLFQEVLDGLAIQQGSVYFDGTLGGAGHAIAIARQTGSKGLVIGTDRDIAAIDRAEEKIKGLGEDWTIRMAHANYKDFDAVLALLNLSHVDGFLLDLGLSSDQLADRNRGFSFDSDGELDLRFDTSEGRPAYECLNKWSAEQIANVIYKYGEERCSRRIARMIVDRREDHPIRSAREVADICRRCVPTPPWSQRIDPATRTFQALRIAVNDELGSLESFLAKAPRFLNPKGRIAIISFHSLEDRIVKNAFRDAPLLNVLTKKPIEASVQEQEVNPRSRSAKLRIAELDSSLI